MCSNLDPTHLEEDPKKKETDPHGEGPYRLGFLSNLNLSATPTSQVFNQLPFPILVSLRHLFLSATPENGLRREEETEEDEEKQ